MLTMTGCVAEDSTLQWVLPTRQPAPPRTPKPTSTPSQTPEFAFEVPYQPIWRCATPTPKPQVCDKDGKNCVSPATATPYVLVNDFPPDGHVQVGPIGRQD